MDIYLQSAAEEVVKALLFSREKEQAVWLVTVISTWGSSPRAPGSMMLWSPSSGLVGSVSGGCVEDELIEKFCACFFDEHKPEITIYGENEAETMAFHLPCGGKLQLLIEALHNKQDLDLWKELAIKLESRQGCLRQINLLTREWRILAAAPQALQKTASQIDIYLGPSFKLFIVGANQIAAYLSQFAQALNFSVCVCDPGENTATDFPLKGLRFLRKYPDGLLEKEYSDHASAVVAVSHDPRLDDMALLEALPGNAFYVGAMGSMQSSKARRKRLQELGVSEQQLKKLKAPIGLDIGSKSPAEIAISIAADLVKASKIQYGRT